MTPDMLRSIDDITWHHSPGRVPAIRLGFTSAGSARWCYAHLIRAAHAAHYEHGGSMIGPNRLDRLARLAMLLIIAGVFTGFSAALGVLLGYLDGGATLAVTAGGLYTVGGLLFVIVYVLGVAWHRFRHGRHHPHEED